MINKLTFACSGPLALSLETKLKFCPCFLMFFAWNLNHGPLPFELRVSDIFSNLFFS